MKIADKLYNFVLYNWQVKRLASRLLRSRVLTHNHFYQKKYQKLLKTKMARYEKVPFRVMIENTNACNSNCLFCPHSFMKRKLGFMEMKLFQRIIEQCLGLGINYVTVYGFGEPLLDSLFAERIKYAKTKGIGRITTNTNGFLLGPQKAAELINAGLDEIYISFDAATEKTYRQIRPLLDFAVIEKNILELVRLRKELGGKKPAIILSFVESDQNRQEVKEYVKKWKNVVDCISVSLIHNWTGDLAEKSNSEGKNFLKDPCRLLWTDMVISWDGRVPLCCNDYENKIILGNLEESSINEIWGGNRLKEIRDYHCKSYFKKVLLCASCTYNFHHKSPWWVSK